MFIERLDYFNINSRKQRVIVFELLLLLTHRTITVCETRNDPGVIWGTYFESTQRRVCTNTLLLVKNNNFAHNSSTQCPIGSKKKQFVVYFADRQGWEATLSFLRHSCIGFRLYFYFRVSHFGQTVYNNFGCMCTLVVKNTINVSICFMLSYVVSDSQLCYKPAQLGYVLSICFV